MKKLFYFLFFILIIYSSHANKTGEKKLYYFNNNMRNNEIEEYLEIEYLNEYKIKYSFEANHVYYLEKNREKKTIKAFFHSEGYAEIDTSGMQDTFCELEDDSGAVVFAGVFRTKSKDGSVIEICIGEKEKNSDTRRAVFFISQCCTIDYYKLKEINESTLFLRKENKTEKKE